MKKVSCPECGQELSLRGLSGHLQFKHGYTAEDVKAAMIEAKEGAIVYEKDLSTDEVILQRIVRMERKLGRMVKKGVQHDEGGEEEEYSEDWDE